MHILKQIGRVLLIVIAVLVILLSVAGIVGAWWLNRTATDVTAKAFSVVDTGVSVAEAGVSRVDTLVQDGRTEVQQAEDTITAVGANLQENSPVLTALSNRLQTRLAPTVDNISQAIAPVREALLTVSNVVEIATSIPGMSQRAPRLARLDQAFDQLEQTAADVKQLDDTLRASVVEGKNQLTQEAVTTMTGITTRVDTRLAEVEGAVDEVQSDIDTFQVEMDETESRLMLIYNLAALGTTLFMLWLVYSQVVVIRHHWRGLRGKSNGAAVTALEPPAAAQAVVEPAPPATAAVALEPIAETSTEPEASAEPESSAPQSTR